MTTDPHFHGGPENLLYTIFDRDPTPAAEVGLPNYWVNTSSLALVIRDTIFRYKGLGPEIAGTLNYHSSSMISGVFGAKWRFAYESEIQIKDSTVFVVRGSGQIVRYTSPPYPAQPGQPVEMVPLDPQFDRLLDYGTHWLNIDKKTSQMYRYDKTAGSPRALLSAISDANGNTVRISYSPAGIIESVTDAAGRTLQVQTDTGGRCIQLSLADGRKAAFSYDPQGRLSHSTDFAGIPSEYTYDNNHCIITMIVGKDRKTTRFSYEGRGAGVQITSVTDAAGHVRRYESISDTPRRIKVTDPENNQTIFQSSWGVTDSIESGDRAVRFTYDAKQQRISATTRLGHTTRFEYDFRGNVTRITDPLGHQVSYSWNGQDHLSTITDALGNMTRISYDERQNPVAITTPSGYTHAYAYDPLGQVIRYTQPGGEIHAFTYDRFGNRICQTSPSGGSLTFDYDTTGLHLTGITDANKNRTSYVHDNNGRLTRIIRPDGSVKEHTFGCCAGLTTKNEKGMVSRYVRDPLLLITEYIDGAGHSLRFTYDRRHFLTSVTVPLGAVTTFQCNDPDRTVTITDPSGHVIRETYDDDGRLSGISDSGGVLYQYGYDACGRLSKYSDAAGGSEIYERDAYGRLTRLLNGRKIDRSYSYTPEGLVKEKAWDGTQCAAFTYDNNGNIIAVDDKTGRIEFHRDLCGQVSTILFTGNLQIGCTYDPMGNIRSIRYPDGLEALYSYDTMGRITRISFGSESILFQYDAVGNPVMESRSNGVDTLWGYDANNCVTEIRHSRGNEPIAHLTYERDANRNIVQERVLLPLYPENHPGPLTVKANRIGQVLQYGSEEFRYDPDGNLIGTGGGMQEGQYDPENRLLRAVRNNRVMESSYNALGQRTGIKDDNGTRRMYYDLNDHLLFETDESGKVTADYIYAGSFLVARHRSGETGFYHFDKTGNTLCITGPDGRINAAYAYDTFGMVSAKTSAYDPNMFTFVGQHGVIDDDYGLYLMKRRHYDAVTGRFIQRDPIGIKGGLNLYAYAGNNPVTQIDPEGTVVAAAVIVGAIIFGVGLWAKNTFTPQGNTIIRGLDIASQRTADSDKVSTTEVQNTMGPDPGKQVVNEIVSAGAHIADKAIGAHPVFGPGYTAVKTGVLLGTGQTGEAIKEGMTVVPGAGVFGGVGGAVRETAGAVKEVSEAAGECKAP